MLLFMLPSFSIYQKRIVRRNKQLWLSSSCGKQKIECKINASTSQTLGLTWLLQASCREVYIFSTLNPVLKLKCQWGYFLWDQAMLYTETKHWLAHTKAFTLLSWILVFIFAVHREHLKGKFLPFSVSLLTKSHSSANASVVISVEIFMDLHPTQAEQEHHHCISQFGHFD